MHFLLPELVTLRLCVLHNLQTSHPSLTGGRGCVPSARSFGSTSILALASTCKVYAQGLHAEVLRATAVVPVCNYYTCYMNKYIAKDFSFRLHWCQVGWDEIYVWDSSIIVEWQSPPPPPILCYFGWVCRN